MSKRIIVQGRPFSSPLSGNKTFTTNFMRHLAEKLPATPIEILVPAKTDMNPFRLPTNCTVTELTAHNTVPEYMSVPLWEHVQVYDYVQEHADDVLLFLSTHHSLPFRKMKTPEVMVLHDVQLWKEPDSGWSDARKLGTRLNEEGVRNADALFSVSRFTESEIRAFFPDLSASIVTMHEDIDPYYKQWHEADEEGILHKFGVSKRKFFLYVGSFEKRKNLAALLEAYRMYRDAESDPADLLIIGSHTSRSKEVNTMTLDASVKHYETATHEELYMLYGSAIAFVYPSQYEGFGLQILEAQNIGCPVIASDIPVFHEVAGQGAEYMNANSPDDIRTKLSLFTHDEHLHAKLVKAGRENAARFTWERTVDTFLDGTRRFLGV